MLARRPFARQPLRTPALLGALALLAAACSSPEGGEAGLQPRGGLFAEETSLAAMEDGGHPGALIYENIPEDFAERRLLAIEPVDFGGFTPPEDIEIDEETVRALAAYLHEVLVERLGDDYEIVETAGPGTLRLQVALTRADPSSGTKNTAGRLLFRVANIDLGSATVEAVLTNAGSGETLLAVVDRYRADRIDVYPLDDFERFGHAQQAIRKWVEALDMRLAALRGEDPSDERVRLDPPARGSPR